MEILIDIIQRGVGIECVKFCNQAVGDFDAFLLVGCQIILPAQVGDSFGLCVLVDLAALDLGIKQAYSVCKSLWDFTSFVSAASWAHAVSSKYADRMIKWSGVFMI